MTQDEIIEMAENAELVVSKHSVWTPEKREFTHMGHTVEGDLANLMQFAELVSRAEREACAREAEKTFYSVQAAENIRARGNK
jgi:hypothetical protein